MMDTEFSIDNLPPLSNGRRYPHELEDPKPIPEDIRIAVLKLLHKYCAAVCLDERTLSEASATTAPARSEASTGTPVTEMSFAFSVNNGSVQPETAKKKLNDVQRTRKALVRKLKACPQDCKQRKVKCPLWHHALRDLLGPGHSLRDVEVVEWAIKYDGELQTPVANSPVSARVSTFTAGGDIVHREDVVDQANGVFNLDSGTPMLYGSRINETNASLLDDSDSPPPVTREDTVVPAAPASNIYSTVNDELMFPLGSRMNFFDPAHYSCSFLECGAILPMQDLISHFETHLRFQHLDDPFRLVCPECDTFYSYPTIQCACSGGLMDLVEKLYGRYLTKVADDDLQLAGGASLSGFSSFGPSGVQGYGGSSYQGFSSFPWTAGYYQNSYQYGSSGSPRGSYHSNSRSALAHFKRSLFSLPILTQRLFRSLVRPRKYVAALVIAATVSLVLGYKEHNWIISKLVQLTHGVPTVSPSKLPVIGVIVASIAFGLHRIIVHAARVNGIRSGWLSRCALNMFNVACGRRPEWPGTTGHELGHSRS